MATTLSAQRCAELIARYRGNKKSQDPSFLTQHNAVHHLLGRLRLSRHNIILAGKFINEMQDAWGGNAEQLELIDTLRERQARSWARHSKRVEEYAAQRAAGTRGRNKKKPTLAPTPAPITDYDPWGT